VPLHEDDPESIGGYRLVDRLGAGGMGVVYWGRSRSGRDVAVKVVHAQYAADPVFRTRFRQEVEAVRKVSGAFTAPVVDADPEAGRPWMATQYVPGNSLAQRIRDRGALRGAELQRLALGLVEALRDIHRAGVVHRDLKPANVLMAEDGPRVIDFGISRAAENQTLTATGQMIGTPPFMSPEQLTEARTVGPASDVFSLGALLVYAHTGRGPFDTDSPYLTAYRVVHDEPVLDGVARPLREVLERCLAKDAAKRPGLDELARAFAAVLPGPASGDLPTVTLRADPPAEDGTDAGTSADAGTPADRVRPRRRLRSRPLWAATGTVGAAALGLTAYLLVGPGNAGGGAADGGTSALPDGWLPWRTTVFEPAPRGAKRALDGVDGDDGGPVCAVYEGSVYCGGDRILPVRLDGRTGKTVWRADIAPSNSGEGTYSSMVLGVGDDTVLVRQTVSDDSLENDVTSVVALDTGTGERRWSRTVDDGSVDMTVAGGLVVMPDGGKGRTVVARSPRTGAERWTAKLPAGHLCGFAPAGAKLVLQCAPETLEEVEETLVVVLDPSDGSAQRLTAPYDSGLLGVHRGGLLFLESNGPLPGADDVPYVGTVLVDPRTDSRTTTKLSEKYHGNPTLAGGSLWFSTSGGEVVAVSPLSGTTLWRTRTSLEQPGPVRYDEATRTVYIASASGRVAALDARKGTLLWDTLPRAERVSDDAWSDSAVLVNEGALVVATADGGVFSIDPAHPDRTSASG
jgi:outer membrane protein assembly factor BamB